MIISDRIYGQFEITEPLILDLLASPYLKRLGGIDQCGYSSTYYPSEEEKMTRLEHSIGVYRLLKIYGASLIEQAAGLIHDLSHSAFSHSIDYILEGGDGKTQHYQDSIFAEFTQKSDIPAILKKHDIPLDYILEDQNFPLKEKILPDLCADRIDYSLRAAFVWEGVRPEKILGSLKAENNQWFFSDFEAAKEYAELFRLLNEKYFTSITAGTMHQAVGDYLGYALRQGYIKKEDLYTTDKEVLEKIRPYHNRDEELQKLSGRMNDKIATAGSHDNYDQAIELKSRLVDPLFAEQGRLLRFSEAEPEWKKILAKELGHKTIYLKFYS